MGVTGSLSANVPRFCTKKPNKLTNDDESVGIVLFEKYSIS